MAAVGAEIALAERLLAMLGRGAFTMLLPKLQRVAVKFASSSIGSLGTLRFAGVRSPNI